MCEFCEGKFPITTHYGKFKIDKLSNKPVITCDLNKCPPFAVCSSKDMNVEMVMEIAYCPICGRKLDTNYDDVSIENKEKFVQIMRQLTAKRGK